MTKNQIAYWQLQEQKRHNLAGEAVDQREVLTKEVGAVTGAIKDVGTTFTQIGSFAFSGKGGK